MDYANAAPLCINSFVPRNSRPAPFGPDDDLVDVPDYDWYGGCFGTASCNLMGTGIVTGFPISTPVPPAGLAPLDSYGPNQGFAPCPHPRPDWMAGRQQAGAYG